ncbi:MAG: hypothetical protein R2710_16835 [Acidimicrobiales bacterium]
MSGSAVGLVIAGQLAERWGSLGPAITVLIGGPILAALLVLFVYPETANVELETLNPSDPLPSPERPRPDGCGVQSAASHAAVAAMI